MDDELQPRAHSLPHGMKEMREEKWRRRRNIANQAFIWPQPVSSQFHFDTWIIQFHKFKHGYKATAKDETKEKLGVPRRKWPIGNLKNMQTNKIFRWIQYIFAIYSVRLIFFSFKSKKATFLSPIVWMQQILCNAHDLCEWTEKKTIHILANAMIGFCRTLNATLKIGISISAKFNTHKLANPFTHLMWKKEKNSELHKTKPNKITNKVTKTTQNAINKQ